MTYHLAGTLALLLLAAVGGKATGAEQSSFQDRAPIADSQLGQVRAGYADQSGLALSFGAVMKSSVDGNLVLQSTINFDHDGFSQSQTLGPGAQPLSSVSNAGLPGTPQTGAVLAGPGGATTFIHGISSQGLSNMVINTANGRNITQTTAITVTIPNLQGLQQQAAMAGFASRLHDMIGAGLMGASPH